VAWSVHPRGLLLQTHSSGVVGPSTRPIATDTQQWSGRSIHAAYCYRRTAVAWSVHPRGLLLQTHSSGVVGPPTRPIATDTQQWRGQSIHAACCYCGYGYGRGWNWRPLDLQSDDRCAPPPRHCDAGALSQLKTVTMASRMTSIICAEVQDVFCWRP